MADVKILASGLGFPEGPVVCADGSVVLTEIRNRRCSRDTGRQGQPVLQLRRRPEWAGHRPRRLLLPLQQRWQPLRRGPFPWGWGRTPTTSSATCSGSIPRPAKRRCSTRKSAATRCPPPTTWCSTRRAASISPTSASAIPRHRDHGGVYYALPDGSKIVEIAFPVLSPNGCGLSPDGKTLYVADTEGARLWAFEVQGPGQAQAPKSEFAPHSGRIHLRASPATRASTASRSWPAATSPSRP